MVEISAHPAILLFVESRRQRSREKARTVVAKYVTKASYKLRPFAFEPRPLDIHVVPMAKAWRNFLCLFAQEHPDFRLQVNIKRDTVYLHIRHVILLVFFLSRNYLPWLLLLNVD